MPTSPTARITAAFLALLGWAALALQLYLLVADAVDRGLGLTPVLISFFSFFTILSNLLVALVLTRIARAPTWPSFNLQAASAVYIAFVGLAYSVLLRHIWDPQGLQKLADVLLHDAIPLLYVIYWFLFCRRRKPLRWNSALIWLIWPAIYLVYVMVRGSITGLYPYHFLDPGHLGYLHVVIMVVVLFAAFVILGLAAIALTRRRAQNTP
jgi:hypothetical protein